MILPVVKAEWEAQKDQRDSEELEETLVRLIGFQVPEDAHYETRNKVMTPDWYKNPQLQLEVRKMLGAVLTKDLLADPYPTPIFKEKQEAVYQHIYNQALRGAQH